MTATIDYLKETWESFTTEYPFDYFWISEDYQRLYQSEQKTSRIFVAFGIFSLIIACLGLVGLISFTAVQRTKEIGIRKVMGSTSQYIVRLFFKEMGPNLYRHAASHFTHGSKEEQEFIVKAYGFISNCRDFVIKQYPGKLRQGCEVQVGKEN